MKTGLRNIGLALLAVLIIAVVLAMVTPPAQAQSVIGNRTPIVVTKYPMSAVTFSASGSYLWTTAQPSLNYTSAILHWTVTGSPGGCQLIVRTGPTAALATQAVDDANSTITCTSAGEKVVNSLNNYFNIYKNTLSGGSSPTVTVYVTLTNGVGWTINQTISAVTQGAAAANHSSPWFTRQSDGTNDMPMMDAAARPGFQKITDGTNLMPTGDAIARSLFVRAGDGTNATPAGDVIARSRFTRPGNGTTAFKDVSEGVGALGVGVQQFGEVSTLSAAAANTITKVVTAPGAGATYLRALLVEKISGASATVTLSIGTGTNCGTNTAVLAGPITVAAGVRLNFGILLPTAGGVPSDLCITTDAAGTGARVLTN